VTFLAVRIEGRNQSCQVGNVAQVGAIPVAPRANRFELTSEISSRAGLIS
jgi:hypothetical protein